MGSMHTGLEDKAENFPRLAAYFAERARRCGYAVEGKAALREAVEAQGYAKTVQICFV